MSPLLKKNNSDQKTTLIKYCMVSGILSFCIMVFTYICHDNSLFFGDQTVLRMDLYHQYGPLYAELYDRIIHGQSLVYSWTSGLGGGFLGNLFNYCCSPFAVFMLVMGHKNMPEAIALMILCKAVASSVAFTYYLNKSNKRSDAVSIAFGQMYTFCGFFVAFSWNIMWLDAMCAFPLVILGIEKIINDRKPALFIVSLTYTMITNYYMAYMVCILSVLFFLYYYFSSYRLTDRLSADPIPAPAEPVRKPEPAPDTETVSSQRVSVGQEIPSAPVVSAEPIDPAAYEMEAEYVETLARHDENRSAFVLEKAETPVRQPAKREKKEKERTKEKRARGGFRLRESRFWTSGWTFAGAAFLSFLLAAFALLPVYFCLRTSSATSSTFPTTFKQYFNLFDFLANHLPAVTPTIRSSGDIVLPNVYSGLLTLLLLPLFFLSDRIAGKKKIVSAGLLVLFYAGFAINYLNYIWHGFHFPNDLPYRYSFAYSFFLLILAYQAILNIREFHRKQFVWIGMGACAFVVILSKSGSLNVESYSLILTVIFTVIYVIIGGVYSSPQYLKKSVSYLLIFFVVMEICFANTGNYTMAQPKKNYTEDYDQYQILREQTEADETEPFYRTELTKLRARMDPCWYGYNGVSTFSSMAYEHTSHMMEKLGLFGNDINSYTYYPQTPIFNSFFSLRYLYDNSNMLSDGRLYTQKGSNGPFTAYAYKYFLPLAFSVSNAVKNWNIAYSSPFDVQNDLTAVTAGVGDCLIPVGVTDFFTDNVNTLSLAQINGDSSFTATKNNSANEATVTLYIDAEQAGEYYVYAGCTHLSSIKITAGDFEYNYVSSAIQPFILDVGDQAAGDRITVEMHIDSAYDSANITFCAARLDLAKFERVYQTILDNGTFNITEFKETSLKGNVNVTNEDGFLFTSIPYDQSWHVIVDGKELEYYDEEKDADDNEKIIKVGGGLIGFDIAKGEHEVEFIYRARGSSKGLLFTFVGLIISAMLLLFSLLKKRKKAAVAAGQPSDSRLTSDPAESPDAEASVQNPTAPTEPDPDAADGPVPEDLPNE